jgi:hypothetical protein
MALADGKNLDLRASDAERDDVAAELGQHFQDGRLDQAEFEERVAAAIAAKTQRDLDQLLTDLPPEPAEKPGRTAREPGSAGTPGAPSWRSLKRTRVLGLLPLVAVAMVIGSLLAGDEPHGWPFAPVGFLWLIVPILVVRTCIGGGRRQWR